MRRFILCLLLVVLGATARADWQTFLRDEPTTQKRDDRVFTTLDRLFKAEREASEADRPYLWLYTTLMLERAQYQFRSGEDEGVPDPAKGACQGWSYTQALALLEARAKEALGRLDLYARTPAAPFLSATRRAPDAYDTSALAVLWQNILCDLGQERFPEAREQVLKAAETAGDDVLVGTLRVVAINDLPFEQRNAALEALDKERVWPADVRALILKEQAENLREDDQATERLTLLMDARDLAADHALKANLQREIETMRQIEAQFLEVPALVPPNKPFDVTVRYRNAKRFAFQLDDGEWVERDLPEAKPYVWAEATVSFPALAPGRHTLLLRVPQRFDDLRQPSAKRTVIAAPFTAARVHNAPFTVFVADSETGAPLAGATVTLAPEHGEPAARTSDVLGLASFPDLQLPPHGEALSASVTWQGQTIDIADYASTPHEPDSSPFFALNADRVLYRPGETVQFQAICLRRDPATDAVRPDPSLSATLVVKGFPPNGNVRDLATFDLKPNDAGSFAGSFALPKDFTGTLRAEVEAWRASGYIGQVQEFKAPAFTVELRRDNPGAPVTEPVRFAGKAIDLSGAPLSGATVSWKVCGAGEPVVGSTVVDADGSFSFEALLTGRDHGQYVSAEAAVLNTNGERQDAACGFWLPQHGFEISIAPDDWAVEDEPFNVTLTAERAVSGTLTVRRDDAEDVLRLLDFTLRQTAPGKAEATLPLALPGGSFTLQAVSGAVTNATGAIVVPRDGDLSVFPKSWRATGALLRTRQPTDRPLKVGETLEGFASACGKGPKFLAITTRDGLRSVIPMRSPFFKLPIEADLAPIFSLTVYAFEGARLRTATLSCDVEPPPDLRIEATRFAETARPGSRQTWEITVDDPDAELLVTCYDKALDEIRPYVWTTLAARFPSYLYIWDLTRDWFPPAWDSAEEPLPWDFCAPGHESRTPTLLFPGESFLISSCSWGGSRIVKRSAALKAANLLGDAAIAAPAREESGGAAAPTPPPRVRTDFAKTALWAPQKRLKDGKAVFTFTLPDTLTTWKLMAFAFTPDGRSGTLTRDCQARLDVMLQPYLPRVLRVGDRLTLNVRLANTTDKPLDTWATLNRGERKPVTLPPKGAATVRWDIAAQAVPGTQTFEFATEGDAVRLDLPVLDNRVRVEDVYPLTLVDTEPTTVDVLEPTAFQDLTVRWDHNPATAVAESLAKVPEWPYESSDQLFANLAASLLLREMKAPLANADAREEEWLDRLLAAKRGDLWPWFPGGPEDACATAEICLGTARLHRLGLAPKPLEDAVVATLKANPKALSFAAWAYTRSAFADIWPLEENLSDALLLAYREATSAQERRLLAIAAKRLGAQAVAEAGLKDVTDALNASKAWGVWWPQERLWWIWWGTPIESHVLGLETLLENGRVEEARAAARWLLQHRRLNGWGTSRATLAAAFGLRLVGAPETAVGPAPTLRRSSERRPGVRRIVYAREQPGLSFGSVVAAYTLPLDQVPPPSTGEDAALTLTRSYAPANHKVGDTVTVTLRITAAQPMSHAWLRDERPANTEPLHQLPAWDWQTGAYAIPGDVATDFFIGTLPRGVTTIQYKLKATHAGACVPGLATLTLTHASDFAARTATEPLTVTP